ncbi:MAG: hypothetical protein V4594_21295 [Bacteroidota bacterium]
MNKQLLSEKHFISYEKPGFEGVYSQENQLHYSTGCRGRVAVLLCRTAPRQ